MKSEIDVFICHAKEDAEIAKRIYADLKNEKLRPWMACHDLKAGEPYNLVIRKAINKSRFFLALLSSNSVEKPGYFQTELRIALEKLSKYPESGMFIIPARVDECFPRNEQVEKLQWVDLFPNYDKGFFKILGSVSPPRVIISDVPEPEYDKEHIISVILFVMTSAQAQELISGSVFPENQCELRANFVELQKLLDERNESSKWFQQYGETPEQWQPFMPQTTENIKTILYKTIERIEAAKDLAFIDIRNLSQLPQKSSNELITHQNNVCIIIMDVISMRHPEILKEFRQSLLDIFPRAIMAKIASVHDAFQISPVYDIIKFDKQKMIVLIERHIEEEIYKRLKFKPDNERICKEICDHIQLESWLEEIVSDLLYDKFRKKKGVNKYMTELKG